MSATIKLRRDTAANWISADPTLALGECGFETDTLKMKIGDGSTAFTALDYMSGDGVTQYTDTMAKAAAVDDAIVDNETEVAPSQDAVFEALALKIPTSYLDTDGTLAANSDAKLATQKAVKTYADQLIAAADAMVFKGVIDCAANPNYPAGDAGDTHKISVAGKIGGASGVVVEVGDTAMCITDSTASGDHVTVGAHWNVIQVNIDGAVVGPASVTDEHIAIFDGVTGKLIKSGGVVLADLTLDGGGA